MAEKVNCVALQWRDKSHALFANVLFLCVCHAECYSEASDHEEAESTEIPPPPYSEQTLRDSMDASGPPGSTHQVGPVSDMSQPHRRLPFI